jgi:hypothetical protein
MKTKRIYRKGFAALALILALAACTVPAGSGIGETIPQGMGLARIRLGAGEDAQSVVRTVLPGIGGYYFTLEFTAPEKTPVNKTLDGVMSVTVALEPAVWTLEVKGYADSGMTAQKVKGSISVPITAGTESNFDVYLTYLTPEFGSGGTGTLNYDISFPASVSRAILGLYPIDDTPGTSHEIDISLPVNRIGTLSALPEGSYQVIIELYGGGQAATRTEAAHVYGGVVTSLTPAFTSADFAACPPVITGATLAAKLDAALASPSGAYTIVLDGTEGDLAAFAPKALNVTDGKNIAVTIRGGGYEVQVVSTGSPLFTLGADAGSNFNLAIQDLTLRGRNSNSVTVVRVNSGGTLLMKAGSLITGNTSSSRGGGVYVVNGIFTMNGGAVSGNAVSSYGAFSGGGGVYVDSGTFTMNGGAVSGNTSSSGSYGGGVYVRGSGTFTMNGGAVSGNTSSSNYSIGGGVYVDSGTFTMNGGAVSGNTAAAEGTAVGGGVYVEGTLTMNGGAVSDNTAAGGTATGGGVYVEGTFTMNGGAVSGNTSSSSGAFSGGGGVTVGGTFTMNGGAVSGNMLSGTGGRGREVLVAGTFKMSGAARPERVFLTANTLFITISGPLDGGPTPIDLGSFTSSSAPWGWENEPVLKLDTSYTLGDLASLKTHFTLGNAKYINPPWTETPIMGYEISDGGLFVAESGN